MKDDQSDSQNKNKRCKREEISASSSENSDSGNPLTFSKGSRKQFDSSDEDDTTNSEAEEVTVLPNRRKPIPVILSDYESGDSIADVNENNECLTESFESLSDDDDDGISKENNTNKKTQDAAASESSSDWDCQSEKCPICLVKFSQQVIGNPESCDHCFCLDCIQEWAKNMNTCPVDRQSFTLILVRQHLEGKVIRQIPVSQPANEQTVSEDATFCEVCGLGDREDRMLLCDACDNGYHMECLNPPLLHVPIEEWHCPDCSPLHNLEMLALNQNRVVGNQTLNTRFLPQNRPVPRMLPRTRQSERVQRNLRSRQLLDVPQSASSMQEFNAGGSTQVNQRRRRATRRTRKYKRTTKNRIKRIVTEDGIIEVRLKGKKSRKYKKKRKSRTLKSAPRSVKGRLANRLGICAPRMTKQTIPDTLNRQEATSAPINHQRHQAGIPTLDIFGRRDQLDYFSGSDQEDDVEFEGSFGVISRVRSSRPSDRFISRKKAATVLSSFTLKKPQKVEKVSLPADGNLLDSILNSQTLWHSKKSEIKSSSDGSLHVVLQKCPNNNITKEDDKIDVRKASAPVIETPMFPGGRVNAGTFDQDRGSSNQNDARSSGERSYEASSHQPSGSAGSGYSSYSSSVSTSSPLRGMAPIRFRMNAPPRRPNIHSYPSDNIPPPPPLRLRSPLAEMTFTATNSPDETPPREEEEIDIYSDIEQDNNSNELEEKSFGTLEPPPEPPFLMTMEPPPEPPAILMNLNEDASDDEASGLVIDDPPPGDVYDPCANSDESSTEDAPLAKPPELPIGLKDSELVADYSSDSQSDILPPSYNPELPTFMNTPIIGPLLQPASHNSSDENDEDCPNFSMYSVASMTLAQRGLPPLPVTNLDIPIPPPNEKETVQADVDIPLPGDDSHKAKENEISCDIALSQSGTTLKGLKNHNEDSNSSKIEDKQNDSEDESILDEEPNKSDSQICNLNTVEEDGDDEHEDDDDEEEEEEEEKVLTENCKEGNADSQSPEKESSEHSVNGNIEMDKTKSTKGLSEVAEDECSTQGDVLDLVIESENNLEHNVPHDDNEKLSEQEKSPIEMEENDENDIDDGDKSDGLVDITDEDMSVYDGQDNNEDLDRFDDPDGLMNKNKHNRKSLDSDDDNSLVGGATSAISAGTINNSDNLQPQTLPGLEGLETETISESEDVNFDELPLEDNEQIDALLTEEDHTISRKKKKKKNRKASHLEDVNLGVKEPLEFEEGEIVDDKPKQIINKKDKKAKNKPENSEVGDRIEVNKAKVSNNEKDVSEKKLKKKKDKNANNTKDKNEKSKEPKEKTLKPGEIDENIAWKKLSKSTKERNYRDGKEKDERERDRENKNDNLSKKEKRNKEKRKELERYNVRRLISEKPKRPKKDEFGRDISPSKSGSSLSPYRPPKYRSPLRTRNRSRTRSRSYKSRSRSRGRRRRSRSRDRVRSRDRSRRVRSRDKSRRSRSQNNLSRSKEKRKTPENLDRSKNENRSNSRTRKKSRSRSVHSRRRSLSYSKSWTLSWSGSSKSRSPSRRRLSRSISRSKSRSWTRDKNVSSMRETRAKDPPKNLTVIVTNKDALKKKDKKKLSKKKDDRKKKKRNSPAPSKEVFTSGDNILVSINFKNANKNLESVPAGTSLLRESSKRKRDDLDGSARKKRNTNSKKSPGAKKSSRLTKINEVTRNAKPVAIIDLDLSPFREQTPSPKEVIVLSDSGDEEDKQHSQLQDELERLGHNSMSQSMLSLPSMDHKQKNSVPQPESPISSSFILNSSGPKTPPEPHIKFSISTKPSQIRMLSNPLMEAEEEMPDESTDNDMNEKLHKGPNTPPEPPPDLNTPASPPTTPYDPFDPTKSRSPSPQARGSEIVPQINSIREDKTDNLQKDESDDHSHLVELHSLTPPIESEDMKQTPESTKVHSTPKSDPNNTDISPKVSPSAGSSELAKVSEDTLMKPVQKLLVGANKLDVTVHKSPEKLITVVINQPVKNQTPKQAIPPLKNTTPIKHSTPKGNAKHQLFSSSLIKQVPMLSSLLPGPPVYTPMGLTSGNKSSIRVQQNGDPSDDMDIDLGSPYSPGSSEGDDLFEPPLATPPRNSAKPVTRTKTSSSNKFDTIFGSSPAKLRHGRHSSKATKKGSKTKSKGNKKEEVKVKLDEDQLKILDELPSSAVEMQVKDKFLKKLNRQERVVEEVKLVLKPHYAKKHVNKEEYKEILRRSVPKICHNKSGEINPLKIQSLVEAYVKKFRYSKKKSTGPLPTSAQNKPKPQKTLWS